MRQLWSFRIALPASMPLTGWVVQVGQKYDLPVRSPLDDGGVFTAAAGPAFEGKPVLGEGNTAVVSALRDAAALLKVPPTPAVSTAQGSNLQCQ